MTMNCAESFPLICPIRKTVHSVDLAASESDIQPSANLNAQKPFSCSTNDMANDYYGAPSTTVNHDFFSSYLRGPTFKATARAGQPAVWSPKTRAPPGGNELSGGRTLAYGKPFAPLAQAECDINLTQPTGVSTSDPFASKLERAISRPSPWELSNEASAEKGGVTCPVLEGAPPPPPPLPASQKSTAATGSGDAFKRAALPNQFNVEGRSTVVIPETESVASLRSKIQSQLTMARPKQGFPQAQVEMRDEQSKPAPTAQPVGSIKDRAKELEMMRSTTLGRPKEEEMPVHLHTEERLFDKLRSPTPQTLSHEAISLTSNESPSRRTPTLSELKSPSPPTIPPTPVELLSPTSRSDFSSGYGNYAGISRFPSDNWASRTLNRAPARPTFQTNTIQRSTLKQERRPSKDYQHQWYKMMFKKLHQIDKNEDNAVMHYRVRDHLGEKAVRDRSPAQKSQQSYSTERRRQFLSPEPVPPDTTVTYRYNRSKSVGRSSSPTSSAAVFSLPTDEKHASHAAVGFRHQPRRIEDYTPGHSSITEGATTAKEVSGSTAAKQSSIQAMLDNSQGLIQRILGDLSREVEQHKANLENYSDIDFWLADIKPPGKTYNKVDAATQSLHPSESKSSRFNRVSALATPPRIRSTPQRGRIYSWSHPVRYRDPGSKLYALERSKTMSFHLPPFRLQRESDTRDRRLLQCVTEAWEKQATGMTRVAECSDKAVQSDISTSVLRRSRNRTVEKEAAYDKLFEELAKAVEDIERMSVAEISSATAKSVDHPRRRSRSLEDTNVSEGRSCWSLQAGSATKPARHSISSCAVPFCPICSGRDGRPESSCTSFGSDSFYFGTNVDSASDVSCSVDTNTECITYRPTLSVCDTGSSTMQRQKHQVPRCKSALDHPRSFNVSTSETYARKSEQPGITDFDRRLDMGQRKMDSVSTYGRPVLARVLYSFVAQNPRELDLYPDDTVTIRRQIDANWCEGEVGGRVGIFPTNYVEPFTEKSISGVRDTASARRGRSMAKVLYDFVARRPRELTIKQGEFVHLIREVDRNWSLGCNEHGQEGMFPSHYVKPCEGVPDRRPTESLTLRKGYQSHSGPSRFASAFDGHSTFSSRPTDRVSKLMIDGVSYDGGVKADSLDAILNEMKLYSSSLLDSKSSKHQPTQPPSTTGITANHSAMYASKIDTYEAVYDYMPENPDELELKRGDIVYVVESYDDGWFIGTSLRTGRFGTFPGNYVKRL
ncbi:SH3 domain protein [Trichuris suis]|nr:SH3 domain protein [Trichuris suis]